MPNINSAEGSLQQQLMNQLKVDDVQRHVREMMEENILIAQVNLHNIIVGAD